MFLLKSGANIGRYFVLTNGLKKYFLYKETNYFSTLRIDTAAMIINSATAEFDVFSTLPARKVAKELSGHEILLKILTAC